MPIKARKPKRPLYTFRTAANPRVIVTIWQIREGLFISAAKFVWSSKIQAYKATNMFFAEDVLVLTPLLNRAYEMLDLLYEEYPDQIKSGKEFPTYQTIKNKKLRMFLQASKMVPFDEAPPPKPVTVQDISADVSEVLAESMTPSSPLGAVETPDLTLRIMRHGQNFSEDDKERKQEENWDQVFEELDFIKSQEDPAYAEQVAPVGPHPQGSHRSKLD